MAKTFLIKLQKPQKICRRMLQRRLKGKLKYPGKDIYLQTALNNDDNITDFPVNNDTSISFKYEKI